MKNKRYFRSFFILLAVLVVLKSMTKGFRMDAGKSKNEKIYGENIWTPLYAPNAAGYHNMG